jgi:acetoacetyl-CoA reductase
MNKLAIVTGGTRGIGAAISINLKESGYDVIANYRSNDMMAEKFNKENNIEIMKWDVSNFNECHQAINEICARKNTHISVLVNNAGITKDSMMHKMPQEDWQEVIKTNLDSCFNMCSNVIKQMRDNNWGRIINISSVNALSGQLGQANYSAAKAGIIGMTKALALESASKNVTVNAIAPGYIATDMVKSIPDKILSKIENSVPVKRLGQPQEIARAVSFLAHADAGYITGETISINGGLYMT